jgi:hypothetical protein
LVNPLAHAPQVAPSNADDVVLTQVQLQPVLRSPLTAVACPLQLVAMVHVAPQTG